MESISLGLTSLVVDSSVLIAAERRKLIAAQAIENIQTAHCRDRPRLLSYEHSRDPPAP